MQLIINKPKKNSIDFKEFIYQYLPKFMYDIIDKELKQQNIKNKLLDNFDTEFSINSRSIIREAIKKIKISETSDSYIYSFSKEIKERNTSLDEFINLISYGTLEIKGWEKVIELFNFLAKNINNIYKIWWISNGH